MTFSEKVTKMIDIIKNARLQLIAKGETVPYDDDIPDVIEQMSGGGQDTQQLINMAERPENTEIVIPEGTTRIGNYAFYWFRTLKKILMPAGVTSIGSYAFQGCNSLAELTLSSSITSIGIATFEDCSSLVELTLPSSLTSIGYSAFQNCNSLAELTLPSSLTSIANRAFQGCSSLVDVYMENGFNCDNLNLSVSTLYSHDTILSWLNALADRTGQTTYTLTIGTTNRNKLSAEEKAIASVKNWNLA